MSFLGFLPLIAVASIGYLDRPITKNAIQEPVAIQLIYSSEAASTCGFIRTKLKNGTIIEYTMMTTKDKDITEYSWDDKKVVYTGFDSDIISRKTINKD